MTRSEELERERQEDYGDPAHCHERIAALWSVWFGAHFSKADVAMMMHLVKVARLTHRFKQDSIDDAKVYLGFYERFS